MPGAATNTGGAVLVELVAAREWSSPTVKAAARFAAARMATYEGSHSFEHALRVHGISLRLARELAAAGRDIDLMLVELGGSSRSSSRTLPRHLSFLWIRTEQPLLTVFDLVLPLHSFTPRRLRPQGDT